ncbi:MAG TPA: cytochrome c [Polyangiales bacterium]|nr:cytochrome c [Polyangiales bacterium]
MASVWILSACNGRSAPLREWRPEDHGQPAELDPARTSEPAEPEQGGVDRAADALFNVSCAGCHGRDGRGQGPGRPPGAQLPDFTSPQFQAQRSDAQLSQVIREGRGLMPPFAKQVNEQGQAALVARIRRFAASP